MRQMSMACSMARMEDTSCETDQAEWWGYHSASYSLCTTMVHTDSYCMTMASHSNIY